MDQGKTYWVYEGEPHLSILCFKEKQPEYLLKGYKEHKCISLEKDLDSYIYFIQNQADIRIKELKQQLNYAEQQVREKDHVIFNLENEIKIFKEILV